MRNIRQTFTITKQQWWRVNIIFFLYLLMSLLFGTSTVHARSLHTQGLTHADKLKQVSCRLGRQGGGPGYPPCIPCPPGPRGPAGPRGYTGSRGPAGAAGPQGPANGLAQYGYIYNTAPQVVAVEADITFNANGILTSGITHAPGTSQITITTTGNYKVAFSVSSVEPNQFALFVNGALVVGTAYGSGAGTQQNSGQAIIALAAGDVLTLRSHTSTAGVTLQTLTGGTQTTVNASLLIEQVG